MNDEAGPPTDASTRSTVPAAARTVRRRPYRPPVLTVFGRVDDLVDAGVVGSAASLPILT